MEIPPLPPAILRQVGKMEIDFRRMQAEAKAYALRLGAQRSELGRLYAARPPAWAGPHHCSAGTQLSVRVPQAVPRGAKCNGGAGGL